jgi:hypothetical protein
MACEKISNLGEENKCTCVLTNCENWGKCCSCVLFHRNRGDIPGCFAAKEKDETVS